MCPEREIRLPVNSPAWGLARARVLAPVLLIFVSVFGFLDIAESTRVESSRMVNSAQSYHLARSRQNKLFMWGSELKLFGNFLTPPPCLGRKSMIRLVFRPKNKMACFGKFIGASDFFMGPGENPPEKVSARSPT